MTNQPHPWEQHYPEGVAWNTPIEQGDLVVMFTNAVAEFSPRVALEYRGREITYSGLRAEVSRFANALNRSGVGPGGTLALYLPNSPIHPFSFFGGLMAGARFLVTNDSGNLHLGGLVGVPSVVVWGPTSPESRLPAGRCAEITSVRFEALFSEHSARGSFVTPGVRRVLLDECRRSSRREGS